jgi:hypothetical protein
MLNRSRVCRFNIAPIVPYPLVSSGTTAPWVNMSMPGSFPEDVGSLSTVKAPPDPHESASMGSLDTIPDSAYGDHPELENDTSSLQVETGIYKSSPSNRELIGTSSEGKTVIAVFGMTGTGKSTFVSKMTGQSVKVGHGLQSCICISPR